MYGVILMVALTSGEAAPDFHFRAGCNGCAGCYGCGGGYARHGYKGCYGCSGCYGTCYGYCYGGYAGGHGCYGSGYGTCYGGSGCSGSCFGGCYGGACHGAVAAGCWGASYGCYGAWSGYDCFGGCGGTGSYAYTGAGMIPGGYAVPSVSYPVAGDSGVPAAASTEEKSDKKGDEKDEKGKDDKKKDDKDKNDASTTRAKLIVQLPEGGKLFVDDKPFTVTGGRRAFNTPALDEGQTYYYEVRAEVMKDGKPVSETRKVVIKAGDVVKEDFRSLGEKKQTAAR